MAGHRLWLLDGEPNVVKLNHGTSWRRHAHGSHGCFRGFLGIEAAICWRTMSRQTFNRRADCSGSFFISIFPQEPPTTLQVNARTSLASCFWNPNHNKLSSHAASIEKTVF